jgi:hypothetical protein
MGAALLFSTLPNKSLLYCSNNKNKNKKMQKGLEEWW